MIARTIADLEACADVLDHHIMAAHQPTATSTAAPAWAEHCSFLPPHQYKPMQGSTIR